ncbi:ion transporter [Litorivicinus lipolyticus]|uniref:Ion transporter n=1 Tax=Litorivicinus lipolyticus TaxID=418701 RepID=A0A5Q2QFF7_9GAMM|nr:ion transporter [Litorivicinus lipolyticus]QGG81101.1 ion transporter [Litorivicinus lipolyticus]
MRERIAESAERGLIHQIIIAIILLNAVVIGLETSQAVMAAIGPWLVLLDRVFLAIFILEAGLKIFALRPRAYFTDGWNLFDFAIVVASLIPTTGQFATLARLARILRVLRLVSAFPELRLVIHTLVRSIPSMGHVVLLMSIVFYIYGVAGFYLFHEIDPTHWRDLGISLLTLFRIVTLEDWTDVMYASLAVKPWAWVYYVSFVVLGTFVVINLFIAVVLNNLDEAKAERLEKLRQIPSPENVLAELEKTQESLTRLQLQLSAMSEKMPDASVLDSAAPTSTKP